MSKVTLTIQTLLTELKKHCEEHEIQNQVSKASACYAEQMTDDKLKLNGLLEFLKNCTDDLVKQFEICLPENAKYFPKFLVKTAKSMVNFLKTNEDLILHSKPEDFTLHNCLHTLRLLGLKQCSQAVTLDNGFPTKDVVCKSIQDGANCLTNEVKRSCIRDIQVDRLLEGFKNAFTEQCTQ